MRTAPRYFCFCAVVLLSTLSFAQGAKVTMENRPANDSERDNPAERARWFLRGRTVNGRPAPELLHRAYNQKLAKRAQQRAKEAALTVTTSETSAASGATTVKPDFVQTTGGPVWTALGPAPSGTAAPGDNNQDYGPAVGRATVVLVDQTDATGNTVYLGGASGGLWKSTNAADSNVVACTSFSSAAPYCAPQVRWMPLIDSQPTLTVGAMTIKPDNNQWLVVGTGEANNSADSYYGLGFLLSQDGGNTWQNISTANSGAADLHGLGTTRLAFNTNINTSLVVATMAAASGGITVGAEFGGANARGIYYSSDAGLHWSRATVHDTGTPCISSGRSSPCTPDAGSANDVIYNPFTQTFYANLRWHGFYSSTDGVNWTRLATQPGAGTLDIDSNCPSATDSSGACPLYRAVMAVVPGRNEMYVWIVNDKDLNEGVYVSTDGGSSWATVATSGMNCGSGETSCGTTQGTYNLTLAGIPNGTATDVYAGAVNEYKCTIPDATQTGSLCNQATGTNRFANLTHVYGDCGSGAGDFANVHPDEHGIDFLQAAGANRYKIIYFANDGGVYRTLNGFSISQRSCNGAQQPWLQFDNLSGTMGSMIQYVWFSQHPTDSATLLGGTQDNGSMAKDSTASPSAAGYGYTWQSVNNGDGGWNDINPTSPNEWFTSNPRLSSGGGIQQCTNSGGITCSAGTFTSVISSSKVGNDAAPFYTTYMLDPQAARHMLVGTCRLWRVDRAASTGTSWGSGVTETWNLDEFSTQGADTCASDAANKVTAIAAGGPCNGACNPGANSGSGTGNGSQVVYVGTDLGKVFVTTNADGGPGTWIDASLNPGFSNNSNTGCATTPCGYPISGIAVDPNDHTGKTAYVTVMGFKTGHVFKTTDAGASWTKIDGDPNSTGLPDNPADAVVVDPNFSNPSMIYVATDVGVFKSTGDLNWTEVGPSNGAGSLPNVATTALRVFGAGAGAKLRVSTYGRGIWEIPVPNAPGFQMVVTPASATIQTNQTATFTGTITPFNGYSSTVTISCTPIGSDPVPQGCTATPPSLTSGQFTLAVSNPTTGTFNFNVTAVGSDPAAVTQQVAIGVTLIPPPDFALSTPNPSSLNLGLNVTTPVSFNLTATGAIGPITLTCPGAGLPVGITCSIPLPQPYQPAPDSTTFVTADLSVDGTVPLGSYTVTITGTAGSLSHSRTVALTVGNNPTFTLTAAAAVPVLATQTGQQSITVSSENGFSGPVTLSTSYTGATISPTTVNVGVGSPATAVLSVPTGKDQIGLFNVPVTGTDATAVPHLLGVPFQAQNYSIAAPGGQNGNGTAVPGGSVTLSFTLTPYGYSGTVDLACDHSSIAGSACTLSPSASVALSGSSAVTVTANVTVPANTASNTYPITINSNDHAVTALAHAYTPSVLVQDYKISASPTNAVVTAGGSVTVAISVAQLAGGFTGTVNFDPNTVCTGLPGKTTCTLDKTSAAAGSSVNLTIKTTAASVAQMRPLPRRGAPLWALWLGMPGAAGLVLLGGAGRGRLTRGLGLLLCGCLLATMVACGGGGGSSTTQPPPIPTPGTPAGTYSITVTSTSGSGSTALTHSTTVTLSVQ